MVYLNRIYTKTGDAGETSLGDGQRVKKTDLRIHAYGSVDELNAVIGLAVASGISGDMAAKLKYIQNDLFDLGADLCVPESESPDLNSPLRITASQVELLERWIDIENEKLTPLKSFILPGGSLAAAYLHVARTVCRRVEINVLRLSERDQINAQVLIYLNRLSDLLFVLGRIANNNGRDDVLWGPGANRSTK